MFIPDRAEAICSRAQAEILVGYDHHRARVAGRWGILITYPWMPLEEAAEPLVLTVVFNPAPGHLLTPDQARAVVMKHPAVPDRVQAVVDQLSFNDVVT